MSQAQTKEKIERIKGKITEKTDLKTIIRESFGSNNRFKEWIEKNKNAFSDEELLYLGFDVVGTEDVYKQTECLQTQNIGKITDTEKSLQTNKQTLVALNVPREKIEKLFTLENIEILERLIESQKFHIYGDELKIPELYVKLENDKNVSMRMNGKIFDRLKQYSIDTKTTIGPIMNYIIDAFLNSLKK